MNTRSFRSLRRGLSLSRHEGRRPTRVRAVKRKCERESTQKHNKRNGKTRGLPPKMNRNVERTRSRWCVIRDARHIHKTRAPATIFLYQESAERDSARSR